jgi:malate dehydrogenase (oxaloacetate-decarboxylating)(NADP+)
MKFVNDYRPPAHTSQADQVARIKARLNDETSPIRKYLYLNSLQDRNETLYYKLLLDNIKELGTNFLKLITF